MSHDLVSPCNAYREQYSVNEGRRGEGRIDVEERREVRWGRSRPGVEIAESGC